MFLLGFCPQIFGMIEEEGNVASACVQQTQRLTVVRLHVCSWRCKGIRSL